MPEEEQRERALTWLNRLGFGHFTNAYPHELSGGMRQRVAIARAFVVQPDILLADEAFGHLDEVTAAELRETFLALARECGSTAILITHQLEEAIGVGDRIVVFGKSAKLLADIHVARLAEIEIRLLREAIQSTLQSNRPDPRCREQPTSAHPGVSGYPAKKALSRGSKRLDSRLHGNERLAELRSKNVHSRIIALAASPTASTDMSVSRKQTMRHGQPSRPS